MENYNGRRVNVRAVIYRDGEILAVKHKRSDGSEARFWAAPGGGLDPHESLRAGVAREVFEETGIKVKAGKLLFASQFDSPRDDYDEELELFFNVPYDPAFENIDLSKTSHGGAEIARIGFVNPAEVEILPRVLSDIGLAALVASETTVNAVSALGLGEGYIEARSLE